MPRRAAYTKVEKTDQIRPDHVAGMGDVAFRGFNCLNAACTQWIVVRDDEIGHTFDIPCQRLSPKPGSNALTRVGVRQVATP